MTPPTASSEIARRRDGDNATTYRTSRQGDRISRTMGRIARRHGGRGLVEGHPKQYSTYKHAIGVEDSQPSSKKQ